MRALALLALALSACDSHPEVPVQPDGVIVCDKGSWIENGQVVTIHEDCTLTSEPVKRD